MKIEDKELGIIRLIANGRSKRVIARVRHEQLQLTHPSGMSVKEIEKVIEEMRPQLVSLLQRAKPAFIFTPESEFMALNFQVRLKENTLNNFYQSFTDGILTITYPATYKYDDDVVQNLVRRTVEAVMRGEAGKIFPEKLKQLAKENNFEYTDVKINKSSSRWGSCSGKKNINLSLFCMLLPEHLIDFIILHELCHTIEMNHSVHFWALLDKVTDNRARSLTQELNAYKTTW